VRLGGYGAGVAGLCGASACVYLGVGVGMAPVACSICTAAVCALGVLGVGGVWVVGALKFI
jgi:hypothetical protein